MASSAVVSVAQEMPEHQSSRGDEFRNLPVEDRYDMARQIVIGQAQANASGRPYGKREDIERAFRDKWDREPFRYHMRRKKETYMYYAGQLGVDHDEARYIWRSMVYEGLDYPLHARQGRI